jgi:gas vesicle protein
MGIATGLGEQIPYHPEFFHMYRTPPDGPEGASEPRTHAAGSPYRTVGNTRSVSMLGLGMVIGAAIGAGIALVAAPQSGEETRDRIRDKVRHLRGRDDSTWGKLGRELKRAAKVRRMELADGRTRHEKAKLERERAEQDAGVKPD